MKKQQQLNNLIINNEACTSILYLDQKQHVLYLISVFTFHTYILEICQMFLLKLCIQNK